MYSDIYDIDLSFITTNDQLEEWLPRLSEVDTLAVDLEFDNNLHRYGFNLCLMQIYVDDQCLLIDPLSDEIDIDLLFPILEDPDIEKVVFSFREDLRLLQSLGCNPKGIFDLDIATSLLNYPQGGLKKLLESQLGLIANSSSQQSNWYRRPLTDRQKDYAAQDVRYLHQLKEMLVEEAEDQGILDWILEENRQFEKMDLYDDSDFHYIKSKYKKGFSELQWFLFKQLMHFRESLAKQFNRPRQKLIHDSILAKLVKDSSVLDGWTNDNRIHPKVRSEEYRDLIESKLIKAKVEAINKGLSNDQPAQERLSREDYRKVQQRKQRMKELESTYLRPIKKNIAEDYGQETASFLLSNRIMGELLSSEDNRTLQGYKKELVIKYAQKLDMEVNVILEAVT